MVIFVRISLSHEPFSERTHELALFGINSGESELSHEPYIRNFLFTK